MAIALLAASTTVAAVKRFGTGRAVSATSLIYLAAGALVVAGVFAFARRGSGRRNSGDSGGTGEDACATK